MRSLDLIDQAFDISLARNVALDSRPADFVGNCSGARPIDVGYDDCLRMLCAEPPGEGTTDAACGAGDDYDPVGQLHRKLTKVPV